MGTITEGAFYVAMDTRRLLSLVGDRIERAASTLQQCKVPFDQAKFKRIAECLEEADAELGPVLLQYVDELDRVAALKAKAGRAK